MAKAGSKDLRAGAEADGAKITDAEFSRPVAVDRLGDGTLAVAIEAGEAERSVLAARFGLLALERLTGEARIERVKGGPAVRLHVDWVADVVQSCVVTLEPVPARLEEGFVLIFSPEAAAGSSAGAAPEVLVDPGDAAAEPPEPLIGGRIDVGLVLAEHLALALDPYPRKPGAVLDAAYLARGALAHGADLALGDKGNGGSGDETGGGEGSPFAVLARRQGPKGLPPRGVT